MKVLKIKSVKMFVSFSFIILLLASSCAQTGNNNEANADNGAKTESTVAKPEMDIQAAVMSGNLEIVRQHIEAGTDINAKEQLSGSTPLVTAATFSKKEIAKALIDADADLSLKNNEGATALHVAAFLGRIEIVQMLIDANADKTAKNNFGATPRETVIAPFADMKPIYEMVQLQLQPLGLQLNLKEVEKNRPVIAMMLQ